MSLIFSLIYMAIGFCILYFVVRLAVRDGINDSKK